MRDMSVSGSSIKNSLISKWLSARDPTRLFQLVLGDGQHVFTAHGMSIPDKIKNSCCQRVLTKSIGLGGSSLINAGVFLKADKRTLQKSPWPSEIKGNPSGLDMCECPLMHDRQNND
jgi:hypothetical protein